MDWNVAGLTPENDTYLKYALRLMSIDEGFEMCRGASDLTAQKVGSEVLKRIHKRLVNR